MSSACACKERECGKFHAHGAFCKQLPRTLASTDQDYLFALNRIPIARPGALQQSLPPAGARTASCTGSVPDLNMQRYCLQLRHAETSAH